MNKLKEVENALDMGLVKRVEESAIQRGELLSSEPIKDNMALDKFKVGIQAMRTTNQRASVLNTTIKLQNALQIKENRPIIAKKQLRQRMRHERNKK